MGTVFDVFVKLERRNFAKEDPILEVESKGRMWGIFVAGRGSGDPGQKKVWLESGTVG